MHRREWAWVDVIAYHDTVKWTGVVASQWVW